jgi:divalent metal cation (Fe/Co/Zn/Cd) transporter
VPEVVAVNFLAAVYSGTRHVLVDLDLDLAEDLDTTRIEAVLDEVEARIREAVPETERVRVELSSPEESRPERAADSTRP